jgi:CHAD domain-containing protein
MARPVPSAHPLDTLRDITTSLEASILLCLAKPRKIAVHRLRTAIRRVEAQLQLLAILPGLPPHQRQAGKALRLLKKLRRAAGKVRDIDVQRDLLRTDAGSQKSPRRLDPELRKQSRQLRRDLKLKREKQAEQLLELLTRHQSDLPLRFEKLLDALAPAQALTLSEAELTSLTRTWFEDHAHRGADSPATPQTTQQLHEVRKRAKTARYFAESAPESAKAAHRLAARFEKLQQTGGDWHDSYLLTEIAGHKLGTSAKLPQSLDRKTDRALRTFQRQLRNFPPDLAR